MSNNPAKINTSKAFVNAIEEKNNKGEKTKKEKQQINKIKAFLMPPHKTKNYTNKEKTYQNK